jgi:cation diffusion facilitator CzcD-associated flavoprotein CzcO
MNNESEVIIVGAGIAGFGAISHLNDKSKS